VLTSPGWRPRAGWTFLPAPSPLAFWARRQAHETAIHRADAQAAVGEVAEYGPDFAADGVDELIMGFAARSAARNEGVAGGPRRALVVRAAETGQEWTVESGADGRVSRVRRGEHGADCTVAGPASDLYLLLWNRSVPGTGDVTVTGDDELLMLWRAGMRVRW